MELRIHDKVILRTPSLPFKVNLKEGDLDEIFNSPGFQESIYFGSPDLFYSFTTPKQKKHNPLLIPLLKYYLRSSFRCTPFGLFAATSVSNWGDEHSFNLSDTHKDVKFDMDFLCHVSNRLKNIPEVVQNLKYFPNSSLFEVGGKLRFYEYKEDGTKRKYILSSVLFSKELKKILEKAQSGATISELIEALDPNKFTHEEVNVFAEDLINSQMLVSELEPEITGDDYFQKLLNKVTVSSLNGEVGALNDIEKLLKKLNNTSIIDKSVNQELRQLIRQIKVPVEEKKLFHVNLINSTSNYFVSKDVKKGLEDGVKVLTRLTQKPENLDLSQFTERFRERYEEREVPLLEVLDPEAGIGYPKPVIGGVTPVTEGIHLTEKKEKNFKVDSLNEWLFHRLQSANLFNEYSIQISEDDLKDFIGQSASLPPSFSAVFRIINFKESKIYLEGFSHSSAINLLARFANSDPEVNEICKEISEEEEILNPEVVIAEVVHLSENRDGNLMMHPPFRKFEIPFLAKSSLPDSHQIPLQDLYISLKDDYIKLRSRRLNKEVIPRISNAYKFQISDLPIYRFLGDLQTQNQFDTLTFNWGNFSPFFSFLPRVAYKKTILHLATWQLPKKEWQHLLALKGTELEKSLKTFCTKWRLPQFVFLAEEDLELFINFKNPLTVKVWLHTIRNYDKTILKEFLFDPETPIRDSTGGKYMNEFIASFIKIKPSYVGLNGDLSNKKEAERIFIPGSEWLYIKYYCGWKAADQILKEAIKPFIASLTKKKFIDKWFFIRYEDPDHHVRLRLHLKNVKCLGEVLKVNHNFSKLLVKKKLVWKVQLDTYSREIERYTSETIEETKELFYFDSVCVVDFITKASGSERDHYSWLWAVRGVDEWLTNFSLKLEDKIEITEELKDSYYKEFDVNRPIKHQIDASFRKNRAHIEQVLNRDAALNFPPLPFHLLSKRTQKVKPLANRIIASQPNKPNHIKDLVKSYIHMFLNRVFPHSQRFQEMIVYDFMWRHYVSLKKRKC